MYNDSAFDEAVTINGGGTVGLTSRTLRAASGQEHDGTAGTGVRIVTSSAGITLAVAVAPTYISLLEIDKNGYSQQAVNFQSFSNTAFTSFVIDRCIIHGIDTVSSNNAIGINAGSSQGGGRVTNNIVYDILADAATNRNAAGINYITGRPFYIANNTVANIRATKEGAPGNDARGIAGGDDTNGHIKNNIVTSVSSTHGLVASDITTTGATTILSNNATEDSTGDITGIVEADQFVSTTAGSEDYHLKAGSDAIDAGTDLGTTDGVNIDIDGWDREGMGEWDIGADEYINNWGSVITSIGTRSAENVDISSVSGSGPYSVTLSSVTSNTSVGDTLNDEAVTPNSYLIVAIYGTELIVRDAFGVGIAPSSSGFSQANTTRSYDTVASWEAALDNSPLYRSGDHAVGEMYNDSAFSGGFTINGGGTVGLASKTLRPASGHGHDGTTGSGVRIVSSATGQFYNINTTNVTIEDIEFDFNGYGGNGAIFSVTSGSTTADPVILRRLIFHNYAHSVNTTSFNYVLRFDGGYGVIENSLFYDLTLTNTSSGGFYAVHLANSTASQIARNITVYDVVRDSGSGFVVGIGGANFTEVKNSFAGGIGGTTSGGKSAFAYGTTGTTLKTNNASDDASADDEGSNHLIDLVAADQFVSITGGSENFSLKAGADLIDVGTDLGANADTDITGYDRDAGGGTWDIGAYEFVGASNTSPTVALNSPVDEASVSDSTPTLEFTGTDADSDPITYQIQIGTDETFSGGILIDDLSDTDAGFVNEDDGGDTDPFTSGDLISYTVQGGDTLSGGTYFWRVRGSDPSGSAAFGAWATTREFVVDMSTRSGGGGHSGSYGTVSGEESGSGRQETGGDEGGGDGGTGEDSGSGEQESGGGSGGGGGGDLGLLRNWELFVIYFSPKFGLSLN
jgi:hypothetical protein